MGYANLRNLAAGIINSDDKSTNEFIGQVQFLGWNYVNSSFDSYSESLQFLREKGFPIVPVLELTTFDLEKLEDPIFAEEYREGFLFEIDGIVIWKDDRNYWNSDNGKEVYQNAMAWKFPAQTALSIIKEIQWTTGVSGYVTPVAKIDPILINGITISSVNLFNPRNLADLNVKLNSIVKVRRANDVIPHINELCVDTHESVDIALPEFCDLCSASLLVDGPRLKCPNEFCGSRFEGVLRKWAKLHEWDFFSDEAIVKMNSYFQKDGKHPIIKIYEMTFSDLLAGMGTVGKSDRLWKFLEEAKKRTTAVTLLASLNIQLVGRKTSTKILEEAKSLSGISSCLQEKYNTIGISIAENYLYDWIERNPEDWESLLRLAQELSVDQHSSVEEKKRGEKGKVVITGSIPGKTRAEAEKDLITLGWILQKTVTKETKYLIAEEVSNSSKFKKAKELHVPVINHYQFMLLNDNQNLRIV